MNPTRDLVNAITTNHPGKSQNAIAASLGVKKQTFSNWATGSREIENLATVVEVCIAENIDPAPWVQVFGQHFATSKKAAAWWAKVGKVAAIVLAAYTSIAPSSGNAASPALQSNASGQVHIMSNQSDCLRWVAGALKWLSNVASNGMAVAYPCQCTQPACRAHTALPKPALSRARES